MKINYQLVLEREIENNKDILMYSIMLGKRTLLPLSHLFVLLPYLRVLSPVDVKSLKSCGFAFSVL